MKTNLTKESFLYLMTQSDNGYIMHSYKQ